MKTIESISTNYMHSIMDGKSDDDALPREKKSRGLNWGIAAWCFAAAASANETVIS